MTRRACSLLVILFVMLGFGWAQSPTTTTTLPKNPKDLMLLAARVNGLGSPDMKSWHLKANYQTFDADGNPKDQGVFEEWWANPTKYKISYASKTFNQIEYRNDDKDLVTGDAETAWLPEEMIQGYLLNPLPDLKDLEPLGYSSADRKFGPVKLKCVEPTHLKTVQLALAKYYCFSEKMAAIRLENIGGELNVILNGIVVAGGHFIASQINVQNADVPLLKVTVADMQFPIKMDDSALAAPASAIPVSPTRIRPGEVAGRKISGQNIRYPVDAKEKRIQGFVLLECDISKTGDVANLRVVTGPKELQQSSYDAVKTWKYKPYLLNGQPVEVRTKITVIYTLDH